LVKLTSYLSVYNHVLIFVHWHLNFVLRWAYLAVNSVSLQSLFMRENLWLSGLCDYLKTLSKPKVGVTEFKITMLYIHYAILWFQFFICWVSISVNWQKPRCSQTFNFVVLLLQLSFLVIYLCILSILLTRIPQGII
jgi:hypothetical protein